MWSSLTDKSNSIQLENMFSQVDEEGHSTALLNSIVDYKHGRSVVPTTQKYIYTQSGQKRPLKSTAGWKLLVNFKDGHEQWIPLKVLKESNWSYRVC